jgi:hypothetical protein
MWYMLDCRSGKTASAQMARAITSQKENQQVQHTHPFEVAQCTLAAGDALPWMKADKKDKRLGNARVTKVAGIFGICDLVSRSGRLALVDACRVCSFEGGLRLVC